MSSIKLKNLLNHFIIIILIFIIDRVSKVYLLNLHENGIDVDFYIFPFLNIYLAWNTGIGFGLFSTDPNIFYHFLTALIGMINLVLIILLFNLNGIRKYFISMILGGSFGNFFDTPPEYQKSPEHRKKISIQGIELIQFKKKPSILVLLLPVIGIILVMNSFGLF